MRTRILSLSLLLAASGASASDLQVGYQRLFMSNNDPGTQVWYQFHHQESRAWSATGRVDYVNRFGRDEGKLAAGLSRRIGGIHSLGAEVGVAPGALVLPRAAFSLEYGRPVGSASAVSAGMRYSTYSASRNVELWAGLEQYLPGNFALFARAGAGRESYAGSNESAIHPSATLKAMYFFTDDDRAWIYHGRGAEGYSLGIDRAPGSIATSTWGIGGVKTFRLARSERTFGVEGNLESQQREGAIPRMLTFSLAFNHRW